MVHRSNEFSAGSGLVPTFLPLVLRLLCSLDLVAEVPSNLTPCQCQRKCDCWISNRHRPSSAVLDGDVWSSSTFHSWGRSPRGAKPTLHSFPPCMMGPSRPFLQLGRV